MAHAEVGIPQVFAQTPGAASHPAARAVLYRENQPLLNHPTKLSYSTLNKKGSRQHKAGDSIRRGVVLVSKGH